MRTVRSSDRISGRGGGVCSEGVSAGVGVCSKGGVCSGGVSAPWGCGIPSCTEADTPTHPPVDRQTLIKT